MVLPRPSHETSQSIFRSPVLMRGVAAVTLFAAFSATILLWSWFLIAARAGQANLGTLGADYRAFAVAGSLAADGIGGGLYESARYSSANTAAFVYPPWFALFMVPWSWFSLVAGYWWWLLITLSVSVASHSLISRRAGVVIAVVPVLAISGYQTALLGQSAFLVAALAALAVMALDRDRFLLAGLALAALSFKPHIALGIVVWYLFVAQGRKALVTAGVAGVVLFGVAEVVLAGSTFAWFTSLWQLLDSLVTPGAEVTIPAAIEEAVGVSVPMLGRIAFLVVGFGWVWSLERRRVVDRGTLLLCTLGVAVVMGPHSLLYDVLALSPAVALAWVTRSDGRRFLAIGGAAVVAFLTIAPFVWIPTFDLIGFRLPIAAAVLTAFIVFAGESLPSRIREVADSPPLHSDR